MTESRVAAQVHPGRSLGWLTLGSSLHNVISRIKAEPNNYPHLDLSYSSSEPVLEPVVLTLPSNGLRLRFDGPDQRLRLIEVLDFSRTLLTYKNTDLVRRTRSSEEDQDKASLSQGPTFKHVYNRLFGPAYPGEYMPPGSHSSTGTYVLSYPGLAFLFPIRHKSWSDKADFVSILSSNATSPATSMAIFSGSSWPEARTSLFVKPPPLPRSSLLATKAADSVPDEIEEAKIYGGGKIELWKRNSPMTVVILSETTAQDLVAELGPPDAVYRQSDSRISIHTTRNPSARRRPSISPAVDSHSMDTDQSSNQSYTEDSDPEVAHISDEKASQDIGECFYNYFHHGFDALISHPAGESPAFPGEQGSQNRSVSSAQLVVTKLIFHANVPGSYTFNRHRRSRWTIVPGSQSVSSQILSSEMSFSEISTKLRAIWHGTYKNEDEERKLQRGMVLNRGWRDSPDSSIELLGGFEESSVAHGGKGDRGTSGATDSIPNLSNTELFGFPGLLFEVLKNDAVSCLTIY